MVMLIVVARSNTTIGPNLERRFIVDESPRMGETAIIGEGLKGEVFNVERGLANNTVTAFVAVSEPIFKELRADSEWGAAA